MKHEIVDDDRVDGSSSPLNPRIMKHITIICINMLDERRIRILDHLSNCPMKRDYVRNVSQRVQMDYMTVKRTLEKMVDLGLVYSQEGSSSFRYYELSAAGEVLVRVARDRG